MATFAKSLPIFFFFLLLLIAVDQTLARESRFFSKVTRSDPTSVDATKTPEAQEVVNVEAKEEEEEEEPSFLPQTSQNGSPYGLYSHPSAADLIPSETTTTTAEKYSQQEQPQKEEAEPESDNYRPSKNYAAELQGIGGGYTKPAAGNYFYSSKKGGGSYYGGEKQGMSDTRFMENGRYFHDVQSEKRPTYYNSGEYRSRNFERAPEYYNKDGYYSGGADAFGNYYNNNARTGFQQHQDQDEFHFDP